MTVTIEAFEVWKRPYEMDTDDPFDALRLFFGGEGRPVTRAAVYAGVSEQGIPAAELRSEYPDVFQQVMTHGLVDEPTDELPGVAAITRGPVPPSPDRPVVLADRDLDSVEVQLEPVGDRVGDRVTPQLTLMYAADNRRLVGFVVHGVSALVGEGQV